MAACPACEADLFDGTGRCPFCGHYEASMKAAESPEPSLADEGQADHTPFKYGEGVAPQPEPEAEASQEQEQAPAEQGAEAEPGAEASSEASGSGASGE